MRFSWSSRFFGDHTSNLSVFGCKYRYLPDKPHLRRLIRGSVCGECVTASKVKTLPQCDAGLVLVFLAISQRFVCLLSQDAPNQKRMWCHVALSCELKPSACCCIAFWPVETPTEPRLICEVVAYRNMCTCPYYVIVHSHLPHWPPVSNNSFGRFVRQLQLVTPAGHRVEWEPICPLNKNHLAITALLTVLMTWAVSCADFPCNKRLWMKQIFLKSPCSAVKSIRWWPNIF